MIGYVVPSKIYFFCVMNYLFFCLRTFCLMSVTLTLIRKSWNDLVSLFLLKSLNRNSIIVACAFELQIPTRTIGRTFLSFLDLHVPLVVVEVSDSYCAL